MRRFIKVICFTFCVVAISSTTFYFLQRSSPEVKAAATIKVAKAMDKSMAGAIEMYCLDFNVSVSKLDLALMAGLQSNGYLGKTPHGVASVEFSPEGKVLYIGTDGSVIGDSELDLREDQSQTWLSGPPSVTSASSTRASAPTIAELGDITPFFATCVKKISTFSVDVDTASFSVAKAHIKNGQLPKGADHF